MKINQPRTSEKPAKADKDAHIIVAWKFSLETNVRLARIKSPIVIGIGKIFEELLTVLPFEPLLLLLFEIQNPLFSTKGGVQTETHLVP